MKIERLDHWVLTVRDIDATMAFYERVLGMRAITFGKGRRALAFVHTLRGPRRVRATCAWSPARRSRT